jgi:tRNA nucleotidyltransferase/poly(A) polymerase
MGKAQKNKIKIIKQIDLTHHFNEDVIYLFKIFENIGANLWVVGGAVRDILLGKEYIDVDFVTDIDSEEIQKKLSSDERFRLIDHAKMYGCITFKSETNSYQVTSMREDIKSYGRNVDTRYTKDILVDAKRRDFTINSFYIGRQGEVLDPLGAYDDMLESKVCFIGDVRQRIEEDNLRILRFLRFAVIFNNRKINMDDLQICIQSRNLILNLSKDRVRDEVLKIISSIQSSEMIKYLSINKFFSILNFQINTYSYHQKISQIKEEIDFELNPIIYFAFALDPNSQNGNVMDAVEELNFAKKEFDLIRKIYNFKIIELHQFRDLLDVYL